MQLVRLAVAGVLAVAAQYLAIRIFDKFTTRIDEVAELRKGNLAVGVVLGAVMVSVAIVVASGVAATAPDDGLVAKTDFWGSVLSGAINLVAAVVLAVAAPFLALGVFEKIAGSLDVQAEMKKGNLAVAALFAAVVFGIALVIQAGAPRF